MLDARIYRTGLVVAALALVVLAFSLTNQQGARSASIAPEAFNGSNVATLMAKLSRQYPSRPPGSSADNALGKLVESSFSSAGFHVAENTYEGETVDGSKTLMNVVATDAGMDPGSIVVLAHRDALGSPAEASMSGTATLIELARDLQGETLGRTVVLASVSGSDGTAGAIKLAQQIGGPVDAVISLGDLASAHAHQPVIVPWSTTTDVAPPVLRNTLASALSAQTSLTSAYTAIGGQFAHLAFPLTVSEQAPFGARGIPAVELSLSGEADATHPPANAPVASVDQITGVGRAVLSTISALDSGPAVAPPSAYVLLSGKVVPGWAISLFVLTLLIPVVLTTIDALARARRRGHPVGRSLGLVIGTAVPFALVVGVVLAARALGMFTAVPPGPVSPGVIGLDGAGVVVMIIAALMVLGSSAVLALLARGWLAPPAARAATTRTDSRARHQERVGDGVAVALLLVMCLVTFALWTQNPFAAALVIPALHLWLWAIDPDLPLPFPIRLVLIAIGVVPIALIVVYYANVLGFGVTQLAWSATLLLAGHVVSPVAAIEWSLVLGCLVSATTIVLQAALRPKPQPAEVTVRGPITYAGPGSLGGTKSAMRR